MRRILVPKLVSYNGYTKRGYVQGGTKAFVPKGTRLPKFPREHRREMTWTALQLLAQHSEFFIKRVSSRQKRIRAYLAKYGVRMEEPIQDLKDGTMLFRKEGFDLISEQGQKILARQPRKIMKQMIEIMAKLNVLEVTHWHPHMRNFAVTENGEIILLDLGRTTVAHLGKITGKMSRTELEKAVRKMQRENSVFAGTLARQYCKATKKREPTRREEKEVADKIWEELRKARVRFAKKIEKQ